MKLIADYLEYLEIEKGRSIKTIDNYRRYLARFISYSGAANPIDITEEVIRKYRIWLNREHLERKTQNYHLIALRGFLKYLVRRHVATIAPEAIELAKTAAHQLDIIDTDDVERLLHAPSRQSSKMKLAQNNVLSPLRYRAILELLFSTGLRVSELCALDREHVSLQKGEFSVRGKGSKIRVVFVSENARSAISRYLEKRGDISPALFVSMPRGKTNHAEPTRLTPRTIQRILQQNALRAGIAKKVTPHMLRHVFATDLSLLPISKEKSPDYDQAALVHAMCVYGCRPPKHHTIYREVKRLGIDQWVSMI
ncbi:MAG: tyrosine-type recombinase/integrase, partial [Patescibacteria group bacterium]